MKTRENIVIRGNEYLNNNYCFGSNSNFVSATDIRNACNRNTVLYADHNMI